MRNTSVTPDGNFVLANSLVNAVTLVTIAKQEDESKPWWLRGTPARVRRRSCVV